MPDVAERRRLTSTLIGLYPSKGDARGLAERADLNVGNIELDGPPRVFMWNVVKEATNIDALDRLIAVALEDYPDNENLVAARDAAWSRLTAPVTAPQLPADRWRPDIGFARAEKVMGLTSTFLPISFLTIGMERARSVARVLLPDRRTGTGFLVRGNRFVTNQHVVPDEETARGTFVQFNFQQTVDGRVADVDEYRLDPDSFWATSPMEGGHDFTIVGVAGDAGATWGELPLSTRGVGVGDRVMIVQHPEGEFKKIALHNNLVASADGNVLLYYTDTMPGSSGSPVFDHSWEVVGLHHAGGDLADPRSGRPVFCNEGIDITWVVQALDEVPGP